MAQRPSYVERKLSLIVDLFYFFRKPRRWWFFIIVLLLLVVGVFIILGESSLPTPIIYALF